MADTKAHKTANNAKATTTNKTAKANKNTKTTKPAKTTTPASTKNAKPATSRPTTNATKSEPAKKGGFAKVLCWIISLLALAAVITAVVVCAVNKNSESSLTTETSKGEKIETAYVNFNDNKFRLKIPTAYKTLSEGEIKNKYGSETPSVVYANNQNNVNIVVSITSNTLSNDQIKEYLDAMKTVLSLSGEIINTDYYQVGDNNVATIELSSNASEGDYYNHMMFFSQDGKLVIVTFNCANDLKDEYKPVSDFVIKSLAFNKE